VFVFFKTVFFQQILKYRLHKSSNFSIYRLSFVLFSGIVLHSPWQTEVPTPFPSPSKRIFSSARIFGQQGFPRTRDLFMHPFLHYSLQ